jgi:uroporphyrinogen-III synthase
VNHPSRPRLGLARAPEDPLCSAVRAAGWEPVPLYLTAMAATQDPPPAEPADGLILLSPAAARLARLELLPPDLPCLAQGPATARALAARCVDGGPGRILHTSADPRAEGLFGLLRERFPGGGSFLLARGERSREFLEQAAAGTPWRMLPWTTHREAPVAPAPGVPELEAVLALSPLQAELLGPACGRAARLAWGRRTHLAYQSAGYPGAGWCEPEPAALQRLLEDPSILGGAPC